MWTENQATTLRRFTDFLLDPSRWPRLDRRVHSTLRRGLKNIGKAIEGLDAVLEDFPDFKLRLANLCLQEFKEELTRQIPMRTYSTPRMSAYLQSEPGNLIRDRFLYVAMLIFKKGRHDKQLQPICPKRDPFANMASYAAEKGYKYGRTDDLAELARKAVSRYKSKKDLAPREAITMLYSHFIWLTEERVVFSPVEQLMLEELMPKPTTLEKS